MEFFKALIFGIVEGITEWLPVSSTGHMILLNHFIPLNVSNSFLDVFLVVIQLGAILAVIIIYFNEMITDWKLWIKTSIATLPAIIVGLLLDDWITDHLYSAITLAITLIVYGILFIIIEKKNFVLTNDLTYRRALAIGCFQLLALIPGTSRSGATIIGAMLLGISRETAAKFTFYLAVPVMFGASTLKLFKFGIQEGFYFSNQEWALLLGGIATACLVSLLVIRWLMNYVKHHTFISFGIYRILLGLLVLSIF